METLQSFLRDLLAADTIDLKAQSEALVNLIAIAWSFHAINWAFAGGGLNQVLCIRPRQVIGLTGIIGAHFCHGVQKNASNEVINGSHIIGNTLAFAPLGWFISFQGITFFYIVTIAVALSSSVGTWLFGREGTSHVGASGVVYGYIGFLLIYGITSGQLSSFLIAVLVLLIYGRGITAILPVQVYRTIPVFIISPITLVFRRLLIPLRISWEMHLFGFLGGAFMALLLSDIKLTLPSS
jgi:Rhomboid family